MKSTLIAIALFLLAATVLAKKAQKPLSSAAVIARGGQRTCLWRTGPYSQCSSTCSSGIQTRTVSCECTVSEGVVLATDENCRRDSDLLKPITTRSCGEECVPTPPAPGTYIKLKPLASILVSCLHGQSAVGVPHPTLAVRLLVRDKRLETCSANAVYTQAKL
jgi:hypothetical protein